MKVSKLARLLGVGLSLAIVLALVVGATYAQDEAKVLRTGINMVGGDLNSIDPALSETSSEHSVIVEIMPGLAMQSAVTGQLEPALSTGWDVSEDGLTYTYYLLEELPWVKYNAETGQVEQVMDEAGNPRYVTANDLVYAWQRALDPATISPYREIVATSVVNGAEVVAGEADPTELGIRAVDDYTFEVTLPEALAFAPSLHGLWTFNPVPAWAIDEFGDDWTEPENIESYGAWAIKDWSHDESITLIKNPFWPGNGDAFPPAKLDEVEMRFLDPNTQITEYEAGNLDAVDVPTGEVQRIQADPTLSLEYVTSPRPCTYYIGFDNTEAPMDNANLRRAFSQAIDRQSLVDNVTRRGEEPAQWFARPGLNAAPTIADHPDLGVKFDVEAAQASLTAALEELGLSSVDELPSLTLSFGRDAGHDAIMQAIQQMWVDNLGINVTLNPMESTTYFANLSADYPPIARSGWCSDYNDANNFLYDVFYSQSSQNDPGFSDPQFDELVLQARTETDADARLELYAQADQILSYDQAGVAPIYWYVYAHLIKPNVEYVPTLSGRQHYELWDIQPQ